MEVVSEELHVYRICNYEISSHNNNNNVTRCLRRVLGCSSYCKLQWEVCKAQVRNKMSLRTALFWVIPS